MQDREEFSSPLDRGQLNGDRGQLNGAPVFRAIPSGTGASGKGVGGRPKFVWCQRVDDRLVRSIRWLNGAVLVQCAAKKKLSVNAALRVGSLALYLQASVPRRTV